MKKINKTIASLLVGAVIAGGLVFGILDRIYKSNLRDIEDQYNVHLYQIQVEKEAAEIREDSILKILAVYEAEIDSLQASDNNNKSKVYQLEKELKDVLNDMWDAYLVDNGLYAYDYLQNRYLSRDTLNYLFSGDQVVEIATDIIKGDYIDSLLIIERNRILNLQLQTLSYESMADVLSQDNEYLRKKNSSLLDELDAWIRKSKLTEDEKEELKKKLRKWQAAGVISTAGLALLLILL